MVPTHAQAAAALAPASQLMMALLQALVRQGTWQGAVSSLATTTLEAPTLVPTLAPATGAIAALPLILFCHESPPDLHTAVAQLGQIPAFSALRNRTIATFAQAVAHVLKPTAPRSSLLPTLLQPPTATATIPALATALQQTQTLLQHQASLHRTIATLTATPLTATPLTATMDEPRDPEITVLALALYCFLSTPQDLRLSLQRAARCPHAPSVCALTGALAGANNSVLGIPLSWRLSSEAPLAGGLSRTALATLSHRLFAVWSGAAHTDPLDATAGSRDAANAWSTANAWGAAIAAPNGLRPQP